MKIYKIDTNYRNYEVVIWTGGNWTEIQDVLSSFPNPGTPSGTFSDNAQLMNDGVTIRWEFSYGAGEPFAYYYTVGDFFVLEEGAETDYWVPYPAYKNSWASSWAIGME